MIWEMESMEKIGGLPPGLRLLAFIFPAGLLAWLVFWIYHFGPVLINDEYAAIDYFYRVAGDGRLYSTPDRLHKPLSVFMGVFSWCMESPLGFELAIAVFGVVLFVFLFLAVREEFGTWPAAICALAVAFHPDVIYYSVTGSSVLLFSALSFVGILAVLRREEAKSWLWVYAACFFVAGLIRPESWLFAGPLIVWWRPPPGSRSGWVRVFVAMSIIGMAPVIWFGKDLIINGDLMHGFRVTKLAKIVGAGAPFTAAKTFSFFLIMIPNLVSKPVAAAAILGAVWFVRERGLVRGLLHPFIVFPAMVSVYLYFIVYMGVFPNSRYYYFDSLFAIVFCLYFVKNIITRISLPPGTIARAALFFIALLSAAGFFLARPVSLPADGRALMLAAALLSSGASALVLLFKPMRAGPIQVLLIGVVVVLALSYPVFSHGLYKREFAEIELEALKQREMIEVAKLLRREVPPGGSDRIMMPSRRNEQLNWILRDREILDMVALREAFYLDKFKGVDFLDLHPDWIMYIRNDYQFWGPDEMFNWLWHQDRATLRDIEFELVLDLETIRVFKITYPPGYPAKGPIPPIP